MCFNPMHPTLEALRAKEGVRMHHGTGGLRNRMRLKKRRFEATREYATLTIQIMGGRNNQRAVRGHPISPRMKSSPRPPRRAVPSAHKTCMSSSQAAANSAVISGPEYSWEATNVTRSSESCCLHQAAKRAHRPHKPSQRTMCLSRTASPLGRPCESLATPYRATRAQTDMSRVCSDCRRRATHYLTRPAASYLLRAAFASLPSATSMTMW